MRAPHSSVLVLILASCGSSLPRESTPPAVEAATEDDAPEPTDADLARIAAASRDAEYAWAWLDALCVDIGHRLSGTDALERAVSWAGHELEQIDGVEVTIDPVEVDRWVRGEESLAIVTGRGRRERVEPIAMIGLGGSVGTNGDSVEGELVVLGSLEELEARGEDVRGKVVLFDVPMPPYEEAELHTGYGDVVGVRYGGPAAAAAHGAIAVLIRSLTNDADSPPHTGMTRYADEGPRIPAAAIGVNDAEALHRRLDEGEVLRARITMGAHMDGTATSHNVVATLRGSERPDEIVIFGGHLDSWDVGQGCQDDGAGVVDAMAALRLIAELGIRPRRTIRVVLFTNEENGLAGATAYAAQHGDDGTHVAGIESDIGAARVVGLGIEAREERTDAAVRRTREIVRRLEGLGLTHTIPGHSGADLSPLVEAGMPGVGLIHDPAHYFDVHHTAADTIATVDHDVFLESVAAMASTVYLLANADERLDAE
ncbi:MAG: M20/M25/M40 family metallo-hydrolase [Sandaracinaceae bacterium]